MDVVSVSPFRAGSVLWRSRPDRWTLTVICKGTYSLAPGEAAIAGEQEDVNERDNHWDDDPRRSVYAPSDLAPFKPRADVMLVGHAFAPRSELARSLVSRLIVGEIEKAVEVTSPRVWTREGELREGQRWNKMPLRWEYSAGGPDTWNPVGVSMNAQPDAYGQRLLPNLQPPGLRVAQWADFFVPVGFGPLASSWRLRRDKLGRRAEGWSEDAWTQIPLDDDFDGEFFQAAPPDQQLETLHDDAEIVLEYLHPDHPRLATKLPGLHPRAFVEVPGSPAHDLVMTADTLWIDTDRALCTLTWRGQVAMESPDQEGRVVLVMEEAGQRLPWPVVATLAGSQGAVSIPGDSTATPQHGRRPMTTLPFRLADPVASPPSPSASVQPASSPTPSEDPPATPRTAVAPRTLQMVTPADYTGPAVWREPTQAPARAPAPAPAAPAWPAPPSMPATAPAPPAEDRASRPEPPESRSPVSRPDVRVPAPPAPALELIWHSSALTGRLRKNGAWARILSPQTKGSRSTMTMVSIAVTDTAEAAEQALETDVTTILARGEPSAVDLEAALFDSVTHGALSPALLLLAGELAFPFDEVAHIHALVTAATPLARADAYLAELLDYATAMARTPLQHAPDVAAQLVTSIREAWTHANRALPPEHLDAQTTRALLASRAYQRRDLLGETLVRASFTPTGTPTSVPLYLPDPAARRLPLYTHFRARILADVLPQQDQHEDSPIALTLGALARMVEPTKRSES